jgi:alanine dehydrogenase
MLIGVPRKIKPDEYRVALTPAGAETLTSAGHQVLADMGWRAACLHDPALALGVNIVDGHVTYPGVAEAFGLDYADVQGFLTPPAQA